MPLPAVPFAAVPFAAALVVGPLTGQLPQFVLDTPPAILAQQFDNVSCVDVDGDADLDLFAYSSFGLGGGSIRLLRNDGGNVFTDVSASLPMLGNGATGVSWFDADGDGDLDAFLTVVSAPSIVLRNVGGGAFVIGAQLAGASGQTGSAVADFDGDGDLDVAVSGSALISSRDRVLLNDGTGQFPTEVFLGVPLSSTVVAGDLDLDGDADLVYIDAGAGLRVLRNDGANVFTDVSATQAVMLPGSVPSTGVGLDLEGDGDLDLVLRGGYQGSDTFVRNVGGVLTEIGPLPGPSNSSYLAVGDVDGDGAPDVVRALLPSGIALSRNDGVGGFVDGAARMPPQVIYSWAVALGDLDGDGDEDLVSCLSGAATLVLRNRDVDLQVDAAAIGQPWTCRLRSRPGYATGAQPMRLAVSLARLPQAVTLPAIGQLWLDLTAPHALFDQVAPPVDGTAVFSLSIPNDPALVGVTLHVQGLVARAPGPPRLTAWLPVTIQ
ncbi:MAG: FG-GAP repeat domain-containing protein [Planctomycetota bacterium]